MIDADYGRALARYNRWMNERLYALCAELPEPERRRDRGAFFGSIHATLDHILYGDLALLSRLTGDPAQVPRLGVELFADFGELRAERVRVDERIVAWADALTPDQLDWTMRFTSQTDGVTRELPAWVIAVHLFNHQAHHRGQLTTLLSQLGIDPGPTDLPKVPGLADALAAGGGAEVGPGAVS